MPTLYREDPSWLHDVPPWAKLLLLASIGAGLFLVDGGAATLCVAAGAWGILRSLGPPTAAASAFVRTMLAASALVGAFHSLGGDVWLGIGSASRLFAMAVLGLAVAQTTRHCAWLDMFERVLAPLARWGVRPARMSLQLALMLRFTEHFFLQWKRMDDAFRARTGKPAGLRVLAPLTIQMLLGARRVGDALHLRTQPLPTERPG